MAVERYRSRSYRWALSTIPDAGQAAAAEQQKDQVLRHSRAQPAADFRQTEYRQASTPDRNRTWPKGSSYQRQAGRALHAATWMRTGSWLRSWQARQSSGPDRRCSPAPAVRRELYFL